MKGPISLMVLALLIIGGSIAYKYLGQQSPAETVATAPATAADAKPLPQREIFKYVPSDTIFFFGGLEPVPFKDMLDALAPEAQWIKQVNFDGAAAQLESEPNTPPGIRFLKGLNIEYVKSLQNPSQSTASLGVGEKVDSVLYSVGLIPVMRVKLADPQAFEALLDRTEQLVQAVGEKGELGSASYRSYSLDKPGAEKKSEVQLIVGVVDGYGIFTVSTPLEREKTLRSALGLDQPESSLSVAVVDDLRTTYKFHPAFIGYVDHREIMKGLTQEQSNAFGRMLDSIVDVARSSDEVDPQGAAAAEPDGAEPQEANPLASIRTPGCQTDLMAVAEAWPRSVFGYTKFETQSKPMAMDFLAVIESRDTQMLEQLRTLRGFLPAALRGGESRPLFGLGVGLNAGAVAPVMDSITQSILQKRYQCEPLLEMQQAFTQSGGTMAAGMVSGMFGALKGVSLTVFDVEGQVDPANPIAGVKGIDALVAITSDNPLAIINAAKSMVPPLAEVEVPLDGSPGSLPFPLPGGVEAKIAVTGRHIVIYAGAQGTELSNRISGELLEAHGLLAFALDYGKQIRLMSSALADNPNIPANQQQAVQALQSLDAQFLELIDITPQGIAFETRMRVH